MEKQKGFTLIEVLIVVVIIGVLAALIIPRFLSAPEKAIVAEANQMLGSLARAQQLRTDTGLTFLAASPLVSTNWSTLQMNTPSSTKFTYSCASPNCTAYRTAVNGTASTVTIVANTGVFSCSGAYSPLTNGGCTIL